jgi:formate-dependent nitrite reductase membrane component NrfD
MSATSPTDALSYYGRPIIKETVWESDIPLYFFTGGLAGASDLLALGAQLSGNHRLRVSAVVAAAAGAAVSPYFLIKDLGRPLRFLNMLRVFKVTSPMSVGTWIFSAESATTGIAAACELFGVMPRLRVTMQFFAGAIGPAQATYTGALVAQSVVPAWHEARRARPVWL